ncbi:single-stranded DNA-binding protein [Pseudomonas tritici]|uniref:single-stranded DNA-binding protein n=1 Tax=Pseudomonas tritici TaxID=2745518 RepID=UPI00387AE5D5
MLRGVCKVILIGNSGEDGIVRYTPAGTAVLRLSIATDTSGKRGAGADWHRVVVLGQLAEDRDNAVRKGSLCYIEGTLRTNNDQSTGASRRFTEVIVKSDGIFRVYHANPPAQHTAPAIVPVDAAKPAAHTAFNGSPFGGKVEAKPTSQQHVEPLSSDVDDEWLSFEGLTLNEPADPFR